MATKHIFVTGGVVSSLGKGITAASLGRLLKARGLKVTIQKLDPYLNVDPGTMSPFQHGEVFVTDDGAETDLDLGHYERFIDESLNRDCNVTAGSVYQTLISKERRGDFLGGTVQVIPHVTNEIKDRINRLAEETQPDVILTEVGGTVGDIESLPFLEAIRQLKKDKGRENVCYIHVTLVPWIAASSELKTKPTQHSVKELRSIGITPDFIVCRSDRPIDVGIRRKIGLFCDVDAKAVISALDAKSIYEVPRMLAEQGLDEMVIDRLTLDCGEPEMAEWDTFVAHAGRIPVCERGPRPRGHLPRREGQRPLGGRRIPDARRGRPDPLGDGRDPGSRRIRDPRHRGQDQGCVFCARRRSPVLRDLSGDAGGGRRVRPPRRRSRRRQLD